MSPEQLKVVALETIHNRFPTSEWLHGFTDGCLLDRYHGTGAGIFRSFIFGVQVLLKEVPHKISFQWIPAHCDIAANEHTDFLVKKGAFVT
ncbi:hypothetical protein TNCV_527651 [Trichonephila clavipes]|nr:hypothetical protein TNCV_527651 [Trichonephila clavipes]